MDSEPLYGIDRLAATATPFYVHNLSCPMCFSVYYSVGFGLLSPSPPPTSFSGSKHLIGLSIFCDVNRYIRGCMSEEKFSRGRGGGHFFPSVQRTTYQRPLGARGLYMAIMYNLCSMIPEPQASVCFMAAYRYSHLCAHLEGFLVCPPPSPHVIV
ncbi:hypothetical protein B0F90DRAFT_1149540 [Multifurca ochricompacta]|uniref:Uncharacterized protein n=1 Tax=Multifurca ochricompacta TaxID=376703 RepID=A0AAD4M0A6_9AGAM|nr:hypothetical protein B0F90DRAFT_1149540 [Multifurca ochricompacta]